jgi:CubicO group peptidase (beta-lactamase class C family)
MMLDDLDSLIQEAMAEWQVPGLAIAVVQHDEPVLVKAFGQRDVEADLPVTTDTQFTLCSVTKSFTATGLAMLADERRLDWMKPVREYLPEFRLHDPVATDRITVADLLSHHSGLPRHDWVWMPGDFSRQQMLTAMQYLEPSRDIRQSYQYQNLGYLAAGMIAERITGQSWEDFTRNRILQPLGMRHVGFSPEDLEQAADSARPYVMVDDQRRRTALWPIRDTPAGGINAAISDMVNYLRFHLADGTFNGARLLSAAGVRSMQTPRVHAGRSEFAETGDQHYGFGLGCHHYRGERAVGHDGGWIGWSTRMDMLPDRKLGVVVLTNRAPSPVPQMLCHVVFDRICGKEPVPWFERFHARRQQFLAQQQENRQVRITARKPDTRPSHALADYAGDYENPGYGRIGIEASDDTLHWQFRGISGPLAHRHYDVFEVPEAPAMLSPDLLAISFGYDREGNIDRLSAPFEPLVGDIVFRRRPAGEALDPAFRAACVGTYSVGPQKHVVALDADGQLTLSPSDQPTYRLLPYQGCIFTVAPLEGFRVEFRRGETATIDTIVFHQPNGTFLGRRVQDD